MKVTLSIKSKTRSYLSEGKCFNKKILQNSIYNIDVWDLFRQVKKKLFKRWETLIRILVKILKIKVDKQLY